MAPHDDHGAIQRDLDLHRGPPVERAWRHVLDRRRWRDDNHYRPPRLISHYRSTRFHLASANRINSRIRPGYHLRVAPHRCKVGRDRSSEEESRPDRNSATQQWRELARSPLDFGTPMAPSIPIPILTQGTCRDSTGSPNLGFGGQACKYALVRPPSWAAVCPPLLTFLAGESQIRMRRANRRFAGICDRVPGRRSRRRAGWPESSGYLPAPPWRSTESGSLRQWTSLYYGIKKPGAPKNGATRRRL